MARCCNCGKQFDYEKYYGICPKCSVYNRENLAEEVHKEVHEQYDTTNPHAAASNGEFAEEPVTKRSPAAILTLLGLLLGILAGILMPVIYAIVEDNKEYNVDESLEAVIEARKERELPQTPKVIELNPQEEFTLGQEHPYQIIVEKAEVLLEAGSVKGFPKEDKLVAVYVRYEDSHPDEYEYYSYYAFETPYAECQGIYKQCLDSYDLEEFSAYLPRVNILDRGKIIGDINGTGAFLVLVPKEIEEITFCMDSRVETTNDIVEIYRIPLTINAKEGI